MLYTYDMKRYIKLPYDRRELQMDIQKTVLVVDDSTTNRSILCDILHSDYTVIQAENGIQALTKLKNRIKKLTL